MATSTVTNTITDATGVAQAGVPVVIRLHPAGAFRTGANTEVAPVYETVTNASGIWSATLERNSDITPANSYYTVEERLPRSAGGPRRFAFQVGAANTDLLSSLVSPLADLPAATYLTQDAADARYGPVSFGAIINGSRPNNGGSAGVASTVARSDHQHSRETLYGTAAARAALSGVDLYEGLTFRETDGNRLLYTRRNSGWLQVGETVVCTSSTRPTPAYEGLRIYETDTDRMYVHNGTSWRFVGGKVPHCFLRRTAAFNHNSTGNVLVVTFPTASTTEVFDTDGMHDGATNTSRITIPSGFDGLWQFNYTITFASNVTGGRAAQIEKNSNGTSVVANRHANREASAAAGTVSLGGSVELDVVAGDYVELFHFQNSGGNLNTLGTAANDFFSARFVGWT